MLALFSIALGSLVAAGFSALAARSLREFSRHELEEICRARQAPERFAQILRNDERAALGVEILIAILVPLAICTGSLWGWAMLAAADAPFWLAVMVIAVTLILLVVVLVVWLPWLIARLAAARFLFWSWPLWRVFGAAAQPLEWSVRLVEMLVPRLTGRDEESDEQYLEEEIRSIVSEGHREGLLENEAREMIEGVIELGDVFVSHIMTPRTEIYMLQANTPWDEVVDRMMDCGHTRVPVYDNTRDEIVGLLYSKDLLPELAKGPDEQRRPLTELLRKPLFVPETKPVDDLLKLFQKTRTHLAVVLDEFGGVSGLVSIEDVLEEIVGEIEDEYDPRSEAEIRKIDDDICETLGRAHIEEINAVMGFELPEEAEFDTIGGFVFAEFGRVPTAGESITWQDAIRVTVLEASRRRVNRVRLQRVRQESLETA